MNRAPNKRYTSASKIPIFRLAHEHGVGPKVTFTASKGNIGRLVLSGLGEQPGADQCLQPPHPR